MAQTADIVGDSVSLLILRDLLEKPRGFTELELALEGVSSRTICAKVKRLMQGGLVTRVPKTKFYPRVDYRLTHKGRALRPVIEAMRAYGKKYL
ncbi:helix-turn-helix transcriptional regulator [Candidatus Kaiserbacteria bacterium]|nr:helix-turn-helix transcriptional regulator [Candidatus Kaiserbacteria bacterium]